MVTDKGKIKISQCSASSVPVNSFLIFKNGAWAWTAESFEPGESRVEEVAYHLESESKEEILEEIKRYVVPLYEIALKNMAETGVNYYWEKRTTKKAPTEPTRWHPKS